MRKANLGITLLLLLFFDMVPLNSYAEYENSNTAEACGLMNSMGMVTRGYKNPDGMGYFCSSPYKELGREFPLANNIAFYAEGDAQNVKKLKLVLNVNSKPNSEKAHIEFANCVETLLKMALKAALPQETKIAILTGSNGKWKINNASISVVRTDWPTGKGYDIKFIIE